jgi:NAD(P)H-flavin reductase
MNADAGKKSLECRLIEKRELTGGAAVLDFEWDGPQPEAGQFFLVRPERSSMFLARPLSAANFRASDMIVSFFAARRGKGMAELLSMTEGEKARLTGPLGNRWADFLPQASTAISGKPLALVAGGVGIAPIAFLRRDLINRFIPYSLFAGFKENTHGKVTLDSVRAMLVARNFDLGEVFPISEDSEDGERGLVTDHLKVREFAAVYACGPPPMLRKVAALCRSADVPCFVSLEERMACGAGACLGCSIPTVSGNKRCCSDGPIFNAEDVFFDEL